MDYKLYLHFTHLTNIEDMRNNLTDWDITNDKIDDGLYVAKITVHDDNFKYCIDDLSYIVDDDIVIFGADHDCIANTRAYKIMGLGC